MSNFEKLKRSVIKEELVVLTGNSDKAVILNQFIYWSERVKDFDKFINEELGRINNLNDANSLSEQLEEIGNTFKQYGWIYKTCEELLDEVMLSISPKTVRRHIIDLVNNGWLEERKNPKYKWDRTLQYRVNLTKIQNDLYNLGYYLADYKVKMPFLELSQKEYKQGTNDTSRTDNLSFQKNDLTFQSDSNVRAIPEITTENTINNNINTLCEQVHREEENSTGKQSKTKKEKYTEQDKELALYLKAKLEERGATVFPRDWLMKNYATAHRLLKTVSLDELKSCIDWLLEDNYWQSRVDSLIVVEKKIAQFQMQNNGKIGKSPYDDLF